MPSYFTKPNATREEYTEHIKNAEARTPIELVSKIHATILNTYEKDGLKKVHTDLYTVLSLLDFIASAINNVWVHRYEEAIAEFVKIDLLPLKKESNSLAKAKTFLTGEGASYLQGKF